MSTIDLQHDGEYNAITAVVKANELFTVSKLTDASEYKRVCQYLQACDDWSENTDCNKELENILKRADITEKVRLLHNDRILTVKRRHFP